jgi:sarcosine oxidase subunit alpha
MVFDDGVTTRIAHNHFHMTTTTGGAARVLDWLEEYLQTEWPELEVYCTSVTEQWATIAVAGPKAGELMAELAPGMEDLPFMTYREGRVAGMEARVFRISFTGEPSFEINVPGDQGLAVWEAVMAAGAKHGITPYGTETMHLLRAEKGFIIVGQETDGTVTPYDLGLDWAVAKSKDFIGRRSLARPDTRREDRKQLVGLLPADPRDVLPEGAQITEVDVALPRGHGTKPIPMVGHVTSSYMSPNLGRAFALALVRSGRSRRGAELYVPLEGRAAEVRVVEPVFIK